jgi:hypothetical protein
MLCRLIQLCFVALVVLPAELDASAEPLDRRDREASEWTQIHPGDDTECAFGTPFSFFFREGPDPSTILIYFEGGGACWEWVSCSGMFDTSVSDDEVAEFRGVFDFANPANPFASHPVVFIPYCTGDVHVGDTTRYYGDPPTTRPVTHNGFRNVDAVLRWISDTIRHAPTRVIIAGTSAGSYGALFYAPRVAAMFPAAAIGLIGDSGVPLLKDYPAVLTGWGAVRVVRRIRGLAGPVTHRELTLERAHEAFASRRPKALLAHITSDRDAIQSAFYLISGSPRAREATYAILDSLQASIPTYRSFVVPGADHGLLVTDRLYSYEADGVMLIEWLQRVVAGEVVDSHRCADCK